MFISWTMQLGYLGTYKGAGISVLSIGTLGNLHSVGGR